MKAVVIGAGIGGLAAAAALRSAGVDVEVHERARELSPAGSALSLSINARVALRTLGIDLDVESRGRVYRELRIRTPRGHAIRTLHFGALGERLGAQSVSIHRADLQQALLEQADGVPITLGSAITGFCAEDAGVEVRFAGGRTAHADVLVGADGFDSVVRAQLHGAQEVREPGYVCWLATLPFRHPVITEGHVAHYWGSGTRFGLADIGHGRVYWWGTRNMPPHRARNWTGTKAEIAEVYAGWAAEVRAVIDATPDGTILAVPARDREALAVPWGRGRVTLLGDAAHPMLPSLAQGAATAVEDAVVLAHTLRGTSDPAAALRRYEIERGDRARQMVDGSWALSRIEQLDDPLPRIVRAVSMRLTPSSVFARRNAATLTFPAPAEPSVPR